jgi:hypothetical protein
VDGDRSELRAAAHTLIMRPDIMVLAMPLLASCSACSSVASRRLAVFSTRRQLPPPQAQRQAAQACACISSRYVVLPGTAVWRNHAFGAVSQDSAGRWAHAMQARPTACLHAFMPSCFCPLQIAWCSVREGPLGIAAWAQRILSACALSAVLQPWRK